MVKSWIDQNPRYNNQPVMGAATVDEGKTAAGMVVGAVAAVATAYAVTLLSQQCRGDDSAKHD
jgi:hypothetical protein